MAAVERRAVLVRLAAVERRAVLVERRALDERVVLVERRVVPLEPLRREAAVEPRRVDPLRLVVRARLLGLRVVVVAI